MVYRVGIIKPINVIITTVKIIIFVILTYSYDAIKFPNPLFTKTATHTLAEIIYSAILDDRFHLLATERANVKISMNVQGPGYRVAMQILSRTLYASVL
jgi:hypothetical protein